MTLVWVLHILTLQVHRLERRRALLIQQEVLCTMFEGIEYRGFGQEIVEDLAKYSSVPVWNGLTNEYHPNTDARRYAYNQRKTWEIKGG